MSTQIPNELKYTSDHEWTKLDNGYALIGITDFAQSSLGDIVYVELPEEGSTLTKGSSFGVVESIKSVSDLYAPLSGTVEEINKKLPDQPDLLNANPYAAWMIKLKISDSTEIDTLLSADQYKEHCNN